MVDIIQRNDPADQYKFRAYKAATQTGIVDNTNTVIQLDSENYDPANMFNTATYTLTIPVAGYWQLQALFRATGTNITAVAVQIYNSGTTGVLNQNYSVGAATGDRSVGTSDIHFLSAGSTIQMRGLVDVSTGTGTMISDGGASSNFSGFLVA